MSDPVRIDLNADLGEGDPCDLELLRVISSCNIACGGHAGDADSMARTIRDAVDNQVAIGAHPSYPDRAGFGRASRYSTAADLGKSLKKQLVMLFQVAEEAGASVHHVKPHGALYFDAAADASLAELLLAAVREVCGDVAIVGPPSGALRIAAEQAGSRYIAEGFADRAYRADGRLVARGEPNAVHADINTMTTQAASLALRGEVTCETGEVIRVPAQTLCIHGDTPNAGEIAHAIRHVLLANGVEIRAAD
jgi:UPF0271 protein